MLDSRTASFTRSDEGYFGCGYAASLNRVAHAVKRSTYFATENLWTVV